MKKTIEIEIDNIQINWKEQLYNFNWKVVIDGKLHSNDTYYDKFSGRNNAEEFYKILIDGYAYQTILDEVNV